MTLRTLSSPIWMINFSIKTGLKYVVFGFFLLFLFCFICLQYHLGETFLESHLHDMPLSTINLLLGGNMRCFSSI